MTGLTHFNRFSHSVHLAQPEGNPVENQSLSTAVTADLHRLSTIVPAEIEDLSARYGEPIRRHYEIQADDYLYVRRWRQTPDRRGEVVFAIQQPNGEILLHTKHQYEQPIYRLLSGGIEPQERVETALYREIEEETGQEVANARFVGLLNCRFRSNGSSVPFVSYVFFLQSLRAALKAADPGEISGYRTIPLGQLRQVADDLRSLGGKRHAWGQWRALAHDLVYETVYRNERTG